MQINFDIIPIFKTFVVMQHVFFLVFLNKDEIKSVVAGQSNIINIKNKKNNFVINLTLHLYCLCYLFS